MSEQFEFSDNVPLEDVAGILQRDISTLRQAFNNEPYELSDNHMALQKAIESPAPVALLKGLQEAGIDSLDLSAVEDGTAAQRIQGVLSKGFETFQDNNLPTPDLDIYYDAQALSEQTGKSMPQALNDIEVARSLQIDGAELTPSHSSFSLSPANDVVTAPEGETTDLDIKEPENYVDIEVISIGRPLGEIPLYGEYGHAALVLRNTETGEARISSAFPVEAYPGNKWDVIRDRAFDSSLLTPFGPAEALAAERNGNFEVIEKDTIRGDWTEINSRLDRFNTLIDEQDIPYRPRSLNSNTYEGDAREVVTGVEPENETDRGYPGRDNDVMDYAGTEFETIFD